MNDRRPNPKIKFALIEEGKTQRWLAKKTKIPEHYISMVIHGKFVFNEIQRLKVAAALGRDEAELF